MTHQASSVASNTPERGPDKFVQIFTPSGPGGQMMPEKQIKYHNCSYFSRNMSVRDDGRYDNWHILYDGKFYKAPVRKDQFGLLDICSFCNNQLSCSTGGPVMSIGPGRVANPKVLNR